MGGNVGDQHSFCRVSRLINRCSLQVNDLSTALLALLLAPRMIETGQKHQTRPRLVVVSSGVHYIHDIDDKVYDAESSFQLLNSKEFCTAAYVIPPRKHGEC